MTEPSIVNATVRRWQLTETLRQLREEAGLTIEQVVARLRDEGVGSWSRSKLSRIETRGQGVRVREVEHLLDLYGTTDPDARAHLLDLASTANERGYWRSIRGDVPPDFRGYLDVEASLVALRQVATMVVPGLLQTTDYCRALIVGSTPGLVGDIVERRVLARVARQQVLARHDPLSYHAIVDEAVLERPFGGAATMRRQLRHLLDLAESDHVTLQILPKAAGASPALRGPFSLLSLPDPIPDFGYVEGYADATYIEDRDAVRECTILWGVLTERALPPAASVDRMEQAEAAFR